MRNRRNGKPDGTTGNVPSGVVVSVVCEPTTPASEDFFVPLSLLYRTATGTSDAGVGRRDQSDRDSLKDREQMDTFCQVPCCPLFPARESFRVFQGNALAGLSCHGHDATSFTGKDLFLKCAKRLPLNTLSLLLSAAVSHFSQDGPEVWPFVAVGPHDGTPDTDITTEPAFRRLSVRNGDSYADPDIPLAVLAEDFGRGVQNGTGERHCSIESFMPPCGDVESSPFLRASNHAPQVEPMGLSRLLDFGAVNQFSREYAGNIWLVQCASGLGTTPIVDECSTGNPPGKAPTAFRGRVSALPIRNFGCEHRMKANEQGRQVSQGIGFISSWEELELVAQDYGVHKGSISQLASIDRLA